MPQAMLDHIIFHTRNIDTAEKAFAAAGFVVQRRNDAGPSHGTESRFIVFEDGAYLLLMQFTDPAKAAAHRLSRFLAHDTGPVDYGIRVADSVTAEQRSISSGLQPSRPIEMRSTLGNGAIWGVRLFTVGRGAPGGEDALPFIVEDLGSRENRVPAFEAHPNGVKRILALHVEAREPQRIAALMNEILGEPAVTLSRREGLPLVFHARTQPPQTGGEGGPFRLELVGTGAVPVEFSFENAPITILPADAR